MSQPSLNALELQVLKEVAEGRGAVISVQPGDIGVELRLRQRLEQKGCLEMLGYKGDPAVEARYRFGLTPTGRELLKRRS